MWRIVCLFFYLFNLITLLCVRGMCITLCANNRLVYLRMSLQCFSYGFYYILLPIIIINAFAFYIFIVYAPSHIAQSSSLHYKSLDGDREWNGKWKQLDFHHTFNEMSSSFRMQFDENPSVDFICRNYCNKINCIYVPVCFPEWNEELSVSLREYKNFTRIYTNHKNNTQIQRAQQTKRNETKQKKNEVQNAEFWSDCWKWQKVSNVIGRNGFSFQSI